MRNYHIILLILCLVFQYQYVMIYSQSIFESHRINLHYPKVIICAMMLDENLYIDEWVQYNKFLGFDFIQIYDNTINGSDYLKHLSNRYHDFVRVEHYSGGGAQMEVYKKCLYKYKTKNIWAAFIDNDEFIVLHKHDNIKHLIYDIKGNNGGALYLNWIIFGTSNKLYYENQLVLKRFTERVVNVSNWGKSISYLPDVNNIRPHWPLEIKDGKKLLDCHNLGNSKSEDIAAVYHFYTRSYEEYKQKRRRGRAAYANWGNKYISEESLIEKYNIDAEKWKFSKNYTLIQDTKALEFFLLKKKLIENTFDCPLINYTLSCVKP